jgi:hypothetical protein
LIENFEIDKYFSWNLPLTGCESGGNGVTFSLEGILIFDPSVALARPLSPLGPEFARTKFLNNLEN